MRGEGHAAAEGRGAGDRGWHHGVTVPLGSRRLTPSNLLCVPRIRRGSINRVRAERSAGGLLWLRTCRTRCSPPLIGEREGCYRALRRCRSHRSARSFGRHDVDQGQRAELMMELARRYCSGGRPGPVQRPLWLAFADPEPSRVRHPAGPCPGRAPHRACATVSLPPISRCPDRTCGRSQSAVPPRPARPPLCRPPRSSSSAHNRSPGSPPTMSSRRTARFPSGSAIRPRPLTPRSSAARTTSRTTRRAATAPPRSAGPCSPTGRKPAPRHGTHHHGPDHRTTARRRMTWRKPTPTVRSGRRGAAGDPRVRAGNAAHE